MLSAPSHHLFQGENITNDSDGDRLHRAVGVEAINAGYQVRFYTFTELVADFYAALADNSLNRKINSILQNDLVILDEIGYLSMDDTASDHIFQVITQAYEKRSLIVTSNLDFVEWGTLFTSTSGAAAILDRLLHHAHVFNLRGDSYRMRSRLLPSNSDKDSSYQGINDSCHSEEKN